MEPVSSGAGGAGVLTRQQQGAARERQARRLLEEAGLRFVAAHVRYRSGEIDLIMRDKQCWVFVEVRYLRSDRFGGAAASVTRQKQQRLLRAASFWLAGHNASFDTSPCRFDVLAITGEQVEWLANAFTAE